MFISNQNISFTSSQLNIVATSDNHGNVHSLPQLTETIKENKNDIFIKSDEASTLNIFAVAGDWHINPSKTGFLTNTNATNGDIQRNFLDKTVQFVHNIAGKSSNFDSVFVLGNHDLDGGDKFFYRAFKKSKMKVLVTNADIEHSSGLQKLMKQNKNVVQSVIYDIPDDKNPNKINKVLFIGITIPSMQFYNPGLLKQMNFFDDCNKRDANLTEDDLQQTFAVISKQVQEFKEQNPKGAVVLLSHAGAPIANMIRDYEPDIDIILNGHDHKNVTSINGKGSKNSKTLIDSLGKDNEIVKSLNIVFDDDGNLSSIDANMYSCKNISQEAIQKNPLNTSLEQSFEEDMKPLISLHDINGERSQLTYNDEIRYGNSPLANYLTSSIKRSIQNITGDKDIIVGIQSSIIRGGLKDGSDNLDIMKIFDGASEELSNVYVGSVSGENLVGLIAENVKGNIKAPKRSTILQWSDIIVNRSLIKNIQEGSSSKKLSDTVKVRNQLTNEFEPIDLNKQYKIALPEKYLIKNDIKYPRIIRNDFISLDKTFDKLFKAYLASEDVRYQIVITPETNEKRIV